MKDRAVRRKDRQRLMRKRKDYAVVKGDPTPRRLSKVARTATPCACEMCRNPRWIEGPTLAERRFACSATTMPNDDT